MVLGRGLDRLKQLAEFSAVVDNVAKSLVGEHGVVVSEIYRFEHGQKLVYALGRWV